MNDPRYPHKFQQVNNLAKTVGNVVWNAAQGNGIFVPEEVKKSRMDICKSCTSFSRSDVRCKECGCFLEPKTGLKAAKCPIDKWGFYTQN